MSSPGGEYSLGRAWGEIVIETDERGVRRAEGSMEGLDRSARRTAEGFEKAEESVTKFEKSTKSATGTTNQSAKAHDALNKKTREAIKAVDERSAAEKELSALLKQEVRDEEAIEKAIIKANKARLEAARISRERRTMERELQKIIRETNEALGGKGDSTVTKTIKINVDGDSARRELKRIRDDVQNTVSTTARIGTGVAGGASRIAAGGGKAMLGGAAAGGVGLLGAGALGGSINVLVSLIGMVTELSGLFGVLPGLIGGTAAVIGTLAVATNGFGEALKGLGEADFENGLKDLSQNARDAAWTLNALWPMIKAGRESIQDNFFKGFSDQILRLSTTVFPPVLAMMQQLASIMNSTIIDVLDRLQTPEGLADMNSILDNIVTGFRNLSEAAVPFFDAFMDIMTVSSSFLPQIGADIANVAREFSVWIGEMRDNGSLANWIQTGITAFKQLLEAVGNFSVGFANIFAIADQTGGGFVDMLRMISQEFRKWTESADGQNNLAAFFTSVSEAARALAPIMSIITNMLFGDLFPALANLGKAMAPQINLFFQNLAAAMTYLRPTIESLSGPLGQFTQVLGETLARTLMTLAPYLPVLAQAFADLMSSLGPEIPGIVKGLADAFIALLPAIPMIIENLAMLAKNILPLLPELIDNIVAILPLLIQGFNFAVDAILGIVNAIQTVIGWGGAFLTFMENLMVTWPGQAGDAMNAWFTGPFMQFIGAIPEKLREMISSIGDVLADIWNKGFDAGKNLVLGLKDGITEWIGEAVNSVKELGSGVVDSLKDLLGIESPSKVFRQLGEYTMQGFAQGIASGTPGAVGEMSTATGSIAKTGSEGVEQFVEDMTQLTGFGSSLLNFVRSISNIAFDIAKLVTTDIFTGKSLLPSPGWSRTVSDKDLTKQREDEAYRKGLENTGGVAPGTYGPSDATSKRLAELGLDPNAGNAKPGDKTVPLKQNPDGTWTSTNPAWAALIARESGGIVDRMQEVSDGNGGPGSPNAAQGLFQITPETWKRAGGERFAPNPAAASAEQQALIAAQIFANNPKLGGDWGAGLPGREDPAALRDGLVAALAGKNHGLLDDPALNAALIPQINGIPQTEGDRQRERRGLPQIIDARNLPKGMAPSEGLKPNADFLNRAITAVFGDELKSRGLTIGGNRANDSGSGEHQGGALDIMTDILGKSTPEGKALGDRINAFILDNAEAFGLQWNIWQQEMKYPNGTSEGMTSRGSITQNHMDHVHAFTGDPDVSGTGSDGTGLFRLPNGVVIPPTTAAPGGTPVPVALDEASLDRIGTEYRDANENQITDEQLQAFLGNNPDLQAAIQAGLDPNSSDSQIGSSLNTIQAEIDRQTKIDTPESRYIAGQLGQQQSKIAGDRGFTQNADPLQTASSLAGGAFSLVSDIIGTINEGIKTIGSTKDLTETLVRGIEDTGDVSKVIDNVQQFITLGASVAKSVSSGLGLASSIVGAAAAGDSSGGAQGAAMALGAASSIAGIVSSIMQTINAAIDLGQEASKIMGKYIGRMLSTIVGAGQGGLLGDIRFLLDKNDGTLKAWSEDNPEDKRALGVPRWLQGNRPDPLGAKMRDLNLYVGPGTDPNEAMNTGMWMIQTDQGGVFTSEY